MADEPSSAKEPSTVPPFPTIAIPVGAIPLGMAPSGHVAVQQVQVWQGQFPPPEAVEHYEQVMPGTFDRLMRMAERQQEESIVASREARQFLRYDNMRGQYLGFAVTIAAMVGAVTCAFIGYPVVAGLLVGVPVLSVAKALVDSVRTSSPKLLQRSAEERHVDDEVASKDEEPRLL